ncbi:MAG: FAD-dependent oxidoreductase [Candidatus Geothermincolia bacterium]
MPYFISGVTADHQDLVARRPVEFKQINDVDLLTRHRVLAIDAGNRTVRVADLEGGSEFDAPYTRLLVSTGARAFVPPFEGTGLSGVFTLRKLADSIRIKEFLRARKPRRAVIVGAGPIGLEMCESLRTLGLEVTLVELAPQVIPMMDADMAARVQQRLEEEGVNCILGQGLKEISGDSEGAVRDVVTESGAIAADLVLLAIGVRPVSELAADAGVELGAGGAIRIDKHMRTSVEGIFSAGDCATTTHLITGRETWIPLGSTARKQGRAAGDNLFGGDTEFRGVQGTAVVKCFDLTVGRTGLNEREASGAAFDPVSIDMEAESLHTYYPGRGTMFLKLTADRGTGRILGAQVVGELSSVAEKRLDVLAVAVNRGMTADDLQYVDLAYAPPYSTATDVPVIAGNVMFSKLSGKTCSCNESGLD